VEYFVLAAVLFGLAFGLVAWTRYNSPDAQTKRALAAVPTLAIGQVSEDAVVRVTGRLRPLADLLQAPLSGRRGAYYLAVIEVNQKRGNSYAWVEVAREAEGVDFVVEDASGTIHVRAEDLRVAITHDSHSRSGTFDDANEVEQKFLTRMNIDGTGLLGFNRPLRYREGVLEPGEEITVLGQARSRDQPGGGRVLVLGPTPHGPAMATDDRNTVIGR